MLEQILFWLLALGATATALMVVVPPLNRKPVHAALSLVISFFFMAGLYVLLLAHLMAVLQVMVYAGAIMVLFLFVIMLLNLSDDELGRQRFTFAHWLGLFCVLFIGGKVSLTLLHSGSNLPAGESPQLATAIAAEGFGTVEVIGDALFRQHLVAFELTAILLLVAVIGAVVLAKRTL